MGRHGNNIHETPFSKEMDSLSDIKLIQTYYGFLINRLELLDHKAKEILRRAGIIDFTHYGAVRKYQLTPKGMALLAQIEAPKGTLEPYTPTSSTLKCDFKLTKPVKSYYVNYHASSMARLREMSRVKEDRVLELIKMHFNDFDLKYQTRDRISKLIMSEFNYKNPHQPWRLLYRLQQRGLLKIEKYGRQRYIVSLQ